jgi:AMP-binding enzyme/Coenzyme A transferase
MNSETERGGADSCGQNGAGRNNDDASGFAVSRAQRNGRNEKGKVVSAAEAVQFIRDGDTLATGGFVGIGFAEGIALALEERFVADGAPLGLTLVYAAGQGDGNTKGLNHLRHEGRVRRVVGGHWGSCPRLQKMAIDNVFEAYNLSQGVITLLPRHRRAPPRTRHPRRHGDLRRSEERRRQAQPSTTEDLVERGDARGRRLPRLARVGGLGTSVWLLAQRTRIHGGAEMSLSGTTGDSPDNGQNQARWLSGSFLAIITGDGLLKYRQQGLEELFMNIGALLPRHARYRPDHLALVVGDQRLTYQKLNAVVNRLANALLANGITKGEKIATVLPNCLELMTAYWAAAKTGIVIVPMSTLLQEGGLGTLLRDSDSVAVLAEASFAQTLDRIRGELPAIRTDRFVLVGCQGEVPSAPSASPAHLSASSLMNEIARDGLSRAIKSPIAIRSRLASEERRTSCRLVLGGAIAPSEFVGHLVEGVRAAGVNVGEAALERGVKQRETLLAFLDQTHAFAQYLALRAIAAGFDKLRDEVLEPRPKVSADHRQFLRNADLITIINVGIASLGARALAPQSGVIPARQVAGELIGGRGGHRKRASLAAIAARAKAGKIIPARSCENRARRP